MALIVLLTASELPGTTLFPGRGFVQRMDLVLGFAWLLGVAGRRLVGRPSAGDRAARSSAEPAPPT